MGNVCFAQTADTFRISDEILAVEVSQFGMGIVVMGASLDSWIRDAGFMGNNSYICIEEDFKDPKDARKRAVQKDEYFGIFC